MNAGATDPENLLYMTRLGLWGRGTAFTNRMSFCKLLNNRGVGAMELVAMDLKMQGEPWLEHHSLQQAPPLCLGQPLRQRTLAHCGGDTAFLAAAGKFLARTLSYEGVRFEQVRSRCCCRLLHLSPAGSEGIPRHSVNIMPLLAHTLC